MQTIQQFIEKHKITMKFVSAPENPHWIDDSPKNPDIGYAHYYVSLSIENLPNAPKAFTMYYSMGHKVFPYSEMDTRIERSKRKPKIEDILDCMVTESDVLNYDNWVDFSLDLGYEIKSHKDAKRLENSYNISKSQAEKFKVFLGESAHNELLYATERL